MHEGVPSGVQLGGQRRHQSDHVCVLVLCIARERLHSLRHIWMRARDAALSRVLPVHAPRVQ